GLITKIILRLQPLPTAQVVLLVPFADARSAIAAVPQIMTRARVVPAAIEFMDQRSVEQGYRLLGERPPRPGIGALLLIEVDGTSQTQVEAEYNAVVDLCLELGALDAYVGDTPGKGRKMWQPRQKLADGLTQLYPIQSAEDLVVPPAQIPDLLEQMDDYVSRHGVEYIAYGHAGDGNLHIRILKPETMPDEQWQAGATARTEDLYRRVAALGGTITAEHGIGTKLSQYLPLVLSPALIELQKRIKTAFDPNDILNPGKIFP
ncbi:MAG TPA: FAD-linked oxidase C-terminal domain-containing protein, partial [Anaerolineae bacterium]